MVNQSIISFLNRKYIKTNTTEESEKLNNSRKADKNDEELKDPAPIIIHDFEIPENLLYEPINRFKYAIIWQRAKRKILITLRLRKMINEVRLFGPSHGVFTEYTVSPPQIDDYFKSRAKNIIDKYHKKKENLPAFVLHPSGYIREILNAFIFVILLYTAIVIPYIMAFLITNNWDFWFWIDFAQDCVFIIDLILNFNTAYYKKDGAFITDRKMIIWHYLTGWFVIDLAASVPFEMIDALASNSFSQNHDEIMKALKLRILFKGLRLSRLIKFLDSKSLKKIFECLELNFNFHRRSVVIMYWILGVLVLMHIAACMFYMTGKLDDFDPDSWIVTNDYLDKNSYTKYLAAFYWAMTTFTSIGYGDIYASTIPEKIVAILWMAIGVYFLSFSISNIAKLFEESDTKTRILDKKMAVVEAYIKSSALSNNIKMKIQRIVSNNAMKKNYSQNERDDMLDDFPTTLKYEIGINMHFGAITKLEFFQNKDFKFISEVAAYLQPMYVPYSEFVVAIGEVADSMYFVVKGRASYVCENNIAFYKCNEGESFGDYEAINRVTRKYNIMAGLNLHLLILTQKTCSKIKFGFPLIWKEMEKRASEKDEKIKYLLAEMNALIKANKVGMLNELTSLSFKKLIIEELKKLDNEKESVIFIKNEGLGNKELAVMKEQMIRNNAKMERIERLLKKMLESEDIYMDCVSSSESESLTTRGRLLS
ncbi:unnamed protein product [Blepharisma stoltei]|uniref:Cyclic nucleotide-binding domain-containing protein n=1 Tax=Blepharisma stoltei TaxID=1481888 RepID=A0AAU9KGU8_9CILI|nr:unnamed protein product [Blepharisma stoltei]